MSKKLKLIPPTKEEDAAINAGISLDPDAPEWTEADFKRARPAIAVAPEIVKAYREGRLRVRGPQKSPIKVSTTLRLSGDVVEFFKSKGRGWQTRVNQILQEYVKSHR